MVQAETSTEQLHKKYSMIFAIVVLLISLGGYILSVSPTVSFWDCGEYIASSESLGIPHPPGNPLYILVGRVFSMFFFFFHDVGFRINLISILSSAVSAMFIYLIIVRAMVGWMGIPDTTWKRMTLYIAGVVGGLFSAFGYTYWWCSVEAEVNSPAMVFASVGTWLVIKWEQSKGDPYRDRLLILFSYLSFLGIGVHMMSMLAMLPVFVFIIVADEKKRKDWRLWFMALSMGTIYYNVSAFFILGPIVIVTSLCMRFVEKKAATQWMFCFWIAFFALCGYSAHLYIPVRSELQPLIDENHPVIKVDKSGKVNWMAFREFMERKQYGSESMVTRAFWRLGAFNKQFGIDGHMGYGGFHLTQFFHFGRSIDMDRNATVFQNYGFIGGWLRLLIYLIPTIMMLYGWVYLYKRNRNIAVLLIFLFLIGSIILVVYMNFADGTRPMKREYMMWLKSGKQGEIPLQYREVRIRDYFFIPGFMFFGMWIGIAAGCILHALFTHKNRFLRTQLAPIMVVLFCVSPALPFAQNFRENNRSHDWVPYDYAYNLLMSCDKDGILFTNGDNDTFPLWALQEAYGVRKDVRIVNLSLLNTKWYIKQLKELEPKVPVSFSIKEIDEKLDHQYNPLKQAVNYNMRNANIVVTLPGRDTKPTILVQDQMVINIVDANNWHKPIYFAVTVSNENLMGLQAYLQMQGLVYQVMPKPVTQESQINIEKTRYFLEKIYSYRSLGDGKAPLNETSRMLMSNYAAGYIQIALIMRQPMAQLQKEIADAEQALAKGASPADSSAQRDQKEVLAAKQKEYNDMVDMVVTMLDQCVAIMPWDWRPRLMRQEVLMGSGRNELAMKRIDEALRVDPNHKEYRKIKARLLEMSGDRKGAESMMQEMLQSEPDAWESYDRLINRYAELGLFDSAIAMARQFQSMYPVDKRPAEMIGRLEQFKAAMEKKNTDSVGARANPKAEVKG